MFDRQSAMRMSGMSEKAYMRSFNAMQNGIGVKLVSFINFDFVLNVLPLHEYSVVSDLGSVLLGHGLMLGSLLFSLVVLGSSHLFRRDCHCKFSQFVYCKLMIFSY